MCRYEDIIIIELDINNECITLSDFIIETEDFLECIIYVFNEEDTILENIEIQECDGEILKSIKKYRKRYLGDRLFFVIKSDYVLTQKPIYISYIPESI